MNEWILRMTDALGWSIFHFLWQSAVVALLLWAALRTMRKASPQARYGTAGFAMLAMLVLPVLTFFGQVQQPVGEAAATPPLEGEGR